MMENGAVSKKTFDHTYSDISVKGKKKEYPSISDYYKASFNGRGAIQYQYGLSNFSSLKFGDDRISFNKSLYQAAMCSYDGNIENFDNGSNDGSMDEMVLLERKEAYAKACKTVELSQVKAMEKLMREKLQQKTTTGPFQLRKTFKYFDRDGSGGIDFSEFQMALEMMGFRFSELQQLALFARYDISLTGEVNYIDFVNNLMEADFTHDKVQLEKINSAIFEQTIDDEKDSAFMNSEQDETDDESIEQHDYKMDPLENTEVEKLFDVIKNAKKSVDRSE